MKRRLVANETDNMWNPKSVELVERNPEPLGIQLVDTRRTGLKSCTELVELAQEIARADTAVRANATSKLELIAEQIRYLQQQAFNILQESKESSDLHHASCNFQKIPGQIYYLYRRDSGQKYFSMLSPDDWKGTPPHEFIGSFRLEYDMSWTPSEKFEEKSKNLMLVGKLMEFHESHQSPTDHMMIDS